MSTDEARSILCCDGPMTSYRRADGVLQRVQCERCGRQPIDLFNDTSRRRLATMFDGIAATETAT